MQIDEKAESLANRLLDLRSAIGKGELSKLVDDEPRRLEIRRLLFDAASHISSQALERAMLSAAGCGR